MSVMDDTSSSHSVAIERHQLRRPGPDVDDTT
jgi:hypothetical protein